MAQELIPPIKEIAKRHRDLETQAHLLNVSTPRFTGAAFFCGLMVFLISYPADDAVSPVAGVILKIVGGMGMAIGSAALPSLMKSASVARDVRKIAREVRHHEHAISARDITPRD